MTALVRLLGWVIALAVLHAASIAPLPFTAADPFGEWTKVSPDAVALVAVAVLGAAVGMPRRFAHLAAGVLLSAMVYRTASVYVALLLERQLDLSQDVLELPSVLHLLTHDGPVPAWAGVLIALFGLAIVELVLAWAFSRAARPARGPRGAVLLVIGLQTLALMGLVRTSLDAGAPRSWHRSALVPLAGELRSAIAYWLDREAVEGPVRARLERAADELAQLPGDFAKLEGADVHVIVVESYGRFALREPSLAPRMQALWRELSSDLREAGFATCTSVCQPANSGGGSWLAHAQMLSGTRIGDGREFRLLLQSSISPLPKRLQAAGYHTVEVMPAMHRHWPEGEAFYGFDSAITQAELGYQGTVYHWGRMPDQFALHHLLQNVVLPAQRPLFTMFVSVTSHVPFRSVPPYVADWQITSETFKVPPRVQHPVGWLDVPNNPKLLTAYADTIEYALRSAVGFTTRLTRPSLVIVLGDHQPPIANVGAFRDPSFDVPIHVFSNHPQLLEPLRTTGFVDGCELPESAIAFDSAAFAPSLLRLYAR